MAKKEQQSVRRLRLLREEGGLGAEAAGAGPASPPLRRIRGAGGHAALGGAKPLPQPQPRR